MESKTSPAPRAGRNNLPRRKPEPRGESVTRLLRAALYAAAIAMVIAGILNGGMRDVLVKAVNICTECIGLG